MKVEKKMRIPLIIIFLIAILIAFNQCVVDKKTINKSTRKIADVPAAVTDDAADIPSENDLPDGLVMPPLNLPTPPALEDEIDVGVKSFEQIYFSMATLTGVNPSDTTLQKLYNEIIVQLPPDNNVQNFAAANQVAITKLAAEFCEKLLETQALRVIIWPSIDFAKNPVQSFTPTNKTLVVNQAIDKFMPPLEALAKASTTQELTRLFDELLTGEDLNSSTTTKKVVKGMCIATMASAHAMFL